MTQRIPMHTAIPTRTTAAALPSSTAGMWAWRARARAANVLCAVAAVLTDPWFVLGFAAVTTGIVDDDASMKSIEAFAEKSG